jgi:hypothetical protein
MPSKRLWITALACAALGGCNTANSHIGDEAVYVGEAIKYDQAIQTINPAPVYPPDASQPGDNGEKGAGNVQKYRKGQVKDVQTMETTSGGGGQN